MTRECTFTQLSLTRVDLDRHRLVRTACFEKCSIGELNTKTVRLVIKLIAEAQIPIAETKTIPKLKPDPKQVPEINPEPEPEQQAEENPSSDKTWHYAAVSVTIISALMSHNTVKSNNELSEKNSTLAVQYASSSSSSEKASFKSEYDKIL